MLIYIAFHVNLRKAIKKKNIYEKIVTYSSIIFTNYNNACAKSKRNQVEHT